MGLFWCNLNLAVVALLQGYLLWPVENLFPQVVPLLGKPSFPNVLNRFYP